MYDIQGSKNLHNTYVVTACQRPRCVASEDYRAAVKQQARLKAPKLDRKPRGGGTQYGWGIFVGAEGQRGRQRGDIDRQADILTQDRVK